MVVFTSPGNERVEPRRDAKTYKIDIECRVWGECLLFTNSRAEVTMLNADAAVPWLPGQLEQDWSVVLVLALSLQSGYNRDMEQVPQHPAS